MISRSMVVERRYAVAVACIWLISGAILLVATIDGAKGDQCTICEDHNEVGMVVCRHGAGRDCVFTLHQDQVASSIFVIAVGGLLLAYSLFVYQPINVRDDVLSREQDVLDGLMEKNLGTMRKSREEEEEAVELIWKWKATKTPGRIMKMLWNKTPCYRCIQFTCYLCMGPCGRVFDWEDRKFIREKAELIEDWMIFVAGGWLGKLWEVLTRCCKKKKREDDPNERGSFMKPTLSRGQQKTVDFSVLPSRTSLKERFRSSPVGLWLRSRREDFMETRCGKCCLSCLAKSPFGHVTEESFFGGRSIDQGRRKAGVGAGQTMEEILAQFGFDVEAEESQDDEKERALTARRNLAEAREQVEDEMQIEAGQAQEDIGVVEEEPEIEAAQDMDESEDDDEDGDEESMSSDEDSDAGEDEDEASASENRSSNES